ncbi:conserved protein of unknown function [Candidatus Filomicrobium marinum]|uniref:DUF2793 domain-containing protein n=1 Tax=Candidatus Filomicrobium marinum TaxID=1608628 RepID=A0A0D6JJU4_9HYPH|nr:DUF2793 domain-containing protein [Candidatus Filomicrobium marinum]CFX55993.1 conserved protein of unknown function [Candidatus Filomicrobium marinum]CPR22216.1 conserved protein of unknown function [Candidatus Filomicrobium marinum]
MEHTPNLGLPYIMAAQAQKHVTHNEAIRALDAILYLAIQDRTLTTSPEDPEEGARYIVAAPATANWAGHENEIAAFQDGAWMFYPPREGWIAWLTNEEQTLLWNGVAWTAFGGGGTPTEFGINATADATNRLSVSSQASLFSHEGSSHQIKINKAAPTDTASTLYQTTFSARAEMGLMGDDDFHFKVSPDGAAWHEAIVIDKDTGSVTLPNTALPSGGGRELLAAPRTYYVDGGAGSDTNTGLSAPDAFATIQKAIDIVASLDLGIYDVTIQITSGTYTATNILKPLVGSGRCYIVGDEGTPANVTIDVASNACFTADNTYAIYHLRGMKLATTGTPGYAIKAMGPSKIYYGNLDFGTCTNSHMYAENGANIEADGNYTISGNSAYHWLVSAANVQVVGRTISLTGVPAFGTIGTQAFAAGLRTGALVVIGNTYVGTATGRRYFASSNGLVDTNGAGTSHLPGASAGAVTTGGEYI